MKKLVLGSLLLAVLAGPAFAKDGRHGGPGGIPNTGADQFAAVVGVRLWWFKRQMRRTGQQAGQTGPMQSRPADIEGEYSVVDDEQQP